MTSLIKNQILKHLTKFFKDLAPEQLQLSAFKGSCELNNLQLDEKVLMDLLSFPAWIKINKATCDQLSIKIPWTKIKSVPIQMNLNEVCVEVEICDEFRDVHHDDDELNIATIISSQPPGKYGFVDRVIDGITVTVDRVLITFKSKLMVATFNLSKVILESRCPNWKPGELSLTKIKDVNRGQILLFKIVEWQNMRLEAKCLSDPQQAPLRLITNHAQCRLTIKKKLDDCSVIAARIFVIFEDILWVLTFAQFISAASFVEYVFTLIKKSPVSEKTDLFKDESRVQNVASSFISPLNSPAPGKDQKSTSFLTGNMSAASLTEQKFLCYDLVETSLHLYIDKVDAHLYDDLEAPEGPSKRDSGGALQTTLDQIQVDCYPYSRATSDRRHWYRWFDPSPASRKQWVKGHLDAYEQSQQQNKPSSMGKTTSTSSMSSNQSIPTMSTETTIQDQLLSLTLLVKIKDYCMNCVATRHTTTASSLNRFIQTDKDYHMPSEMPSFYFELNYFYYFDPIKRLMIYDDVPNPLAFIHLSPTKVLFDSPTLLFLNSFQANLSKALEHLDDLFPDETSAPKIHCRIEILMPQISLPAKNSNSSTDSTAATGPGKSSTSSNVKTEQQQTKAATSFLLLKSGKITLANSIYDKNLLSKLMSSIEKLKENPSKPINLGSSYQQTTSGGSDDNNSTMKSGLNKIGGDDTDSDACIGDWAKVWNASVINKMTEFNVCNQFWSIESEPVWIDFMNYDVDNLSANQRLESIVEPFNAHIFVHLDLSSTFNKDKKHVKNLTSSNFNFDSELIANRNKKQHRDVISILVSVLDESIMANMDKIQFSFLQRLGMQVEKLLHQIKEDASTIIKLETVYENTLEVNLTAYIREIKARLILDKKLETQTTTTIGMNANISADNQLNDEQSKLEHEEQRKKIDFISQLSPFSSNKPTTIHDTTSRRHIATQPQSIIVQQPLIPVEIPATEQKVIESNQLEIRDVLGSDEDLDECTEVADDASCLLLSESLGTSSSLGTSQNQSHHSTSQVQLHRQASPEKIPSRAQSRTQSIYSASPSKSDFNIEQQQQQQQQSDFGKKKDSFLIELEEFEKSASLFEKVNLNPKRQSPSPIPTSSSPSTQVKPDLAASPQKQFEMETISYLELSMSQLMVRRITETKRRSKP